MKRVTTLIGAAISVLGLCLALAKPALAYNNLISNPSVETASNAVAPVDWQSSSWGNNVVNFSYKSTGQSGSHSLRVDVSGYQNGDAKWYFKPVGTQELNHYTYSDYYKSSVASSLVAAFTMIDGSTAYSWLGDLPASSNWKLAATNVVTPQGVKQATVYHLIAANGYLQTDSFVFKHAEDIAVSSGIGNSSVETQDEVSSTSPAGWTAGKWGSNTATFNYVKTAGYASNRSVKVTVSNYTDGDAKWYFDPVSVTAGSSYVFSDYYKSNTTSEVVVRFSFADGGESYQWLGNAAASTAWKRVAYEFTVPSGATKATVMHLLASNGTLQTDAFSLMEPAQAVLTAGVPNNSLEQVSDLDSALPLAWSKASWGTNMPKFTYLATGHSGSRSVKVELTKYTDGDAKWMYREQPVVPGQTYRFAAFYQGTTSGHPVAMITNQDSSVSYIGMHSADPASNWTEYSDSFTAPNSAKSVTVFFYINTVGSFTSDDYSLTSLNLAGFDKGRLSLTFDDGWEENVTSVLPLLTSYGLKSTQFYTSQYITQTGDTSGVRAFASAGHEIGSHTVTHPDLTLLTIDQVIAELANSKAALEAAIGAPVTNFAAPYGTYNTVVTNEIAKLYRSNRSVDEGYNSKDNFNIYRLKVQNILLDTTPAQIAAWITKAQQDKTWLILVYHKVGALDLGPYDTRNADFAQDLAAVQSSGISTVTINQGLNELLPQL